jgi:hypothetical protein
MYSTGNPIRRNAIARSEKRSREPQALAAGSGRRHHVSAAALAIVPTGRTVIAQGNALGTMPNCPNHPKGVNGLARRGVRQDHVWTAIPSMDVTAHGHGSPRWGKRLGGRAIPRALPGAITVSAVGRPSPGRPHEGVPRNPSACCRGSAAALSIVERCHPIRIAERDQAKRSSMRSRATSSFSAVS